MKSINLNLKFWLAGFVAGVVLMERWRRSGGRQLPASGVSGGVDTWSTNVSAQKPKLSTTIVAGAKADAERARQMLKQVKPSKSEAVDSPSPSTVDSA